MATLNYHHLRYFWVIANENNLTRAAEKLHISQSALSIQLRKLEESFGQNLFEREGRQLILTEAGHIALDYAQAIFRAGDELSSVMLRRGAGNRHLLRVGAVSTLSRNFQLDLIKPLLAMEDIELVLHSGSLKTLMQQMQEHTLDLILSNRPAPDALDRNWQCHLLDEQSASLVCQSRTAPANLRFPDDLHHAELLVPSMESEIRTAFDFLLNQAGVRPKIIAEVDDMAMLRLLARESGTLTLVPPVVVRDELLSGHLVECVQIAEVKERFYAITPERHFPNPILKTLFHTFKPSNQGETVL
jgi:LysR family transcriptional activator of nhaA